MLTLKQGKTTTEKSDKKVQNAVKIFVKTKEEIDKLNEELNNQKEIISLFADENRGESNTISIIDPNSGEVKVTFGQELKIKNEEKLREILGDRFEDLVTVQTKFKPEKKLKEEAIENEKIALCIEVKEKTPSVTVAKIST